MFEFNDILNERDARRARSMLEKARELSSLSASLENARSGLSPSVVEKHRRAVAGVVRELAAALNRYEEAKAGNVEALMDTYGGDPGTALVIARIARGLSQSALAEKLGIREQQIQRYEAEHYRTIGLANYRKIAHLLGVELRAVIRPESRSVFSNLSQEIEFDQESLINVADHAIRHRWFEIEPSIDKTAHLLEYIKYSSKKLGSPSLFRAGLVNNDPPQDILMVAWRARVVAVSEIDIDRGLPPFNLLDIEWLPEFIKLSAEDDGPRRAAERLREKGIAFVYEPQIPGLRLDGAAMLVRGSPVIALTVRHDRIDNFWFTLLHEIAHVYLHFRMGLALGFYDDLDAVGFDEIESEADEFAGSALIPNEQWRLSGARIAKDPAPVEKFARQLGIHPAIVFGRIRMERQNYKIFSDRVGAGGVRSQFIKKEAGY